ncbi:MAG: hypothetical protein ACI9R3_002502 [Verrucomicrobiales bacterium]|jgi:uncharacterized protein YbjT (DUF2867 family)
MSNVKSVVMIGATGAVGGHCAHRLVSLPDVNRLTLLGRRELEGVACEELEQHRVDLFDPDSYKTLLSGHTTAICTVGVGQPSKTSRDEFLKIDKHLVLDFARECKASGIRHFQLLSSVSVNAQSRSFYLRTKGELNDALEALAFERLSLFCPSMILTPENRYGIGQGMLLKIWPFLHPMIVGPLRNFKGIKVDILGNAIAHNTTTSGSGIERLYWDDFLTLADSSA